MSVVCKYCHLPEIEDSDMFRCSSCLLKVHVDCLKRGAVPGGILGDIFFTYTCAECTDGTSELFVRDKIAWFQLIYLVLYNLSNKSPGISRNGFYHWKLHIASFIEQHWERLFARDTKRKKKWIGTVSGCLSIYNNLIFLSGSSILNELGWWALKHPHLKPSYILHYANEICSIKGNKSKPIPTSGEFTILEDFLRSKNVSENALRKLDLEAVRAEISSNKDQANGAPIKLEPTDEKVHLINGRKRKNLLPTVENYSDLNGLKSNASRSYLYKTISDAVSMDMEPIKEIEEKATEKPVILKDPMCHYNTSLNSICRIEGLRLAQKLLGALTEDTILSPYSGLHLKPYIRRDADAQPAWLSLMADVLLVSNYRHSLEYRLPPRYTVDYAYVQPAHIPAVNSLCNHFFWPGIDLTDCLQYPEFSCVALYRRLIIGFAFVVPDVSMNEAYISFVFVRPGWRNVGIARFMIYHLIQMCSGKDITLHVSINNPALFLYQKFGFKVEKVVLDFYNKYFRRDSFESKHAFFCRLER